MVSPEGKSLPLLGMWFLSFLLFSACDQNRIYEKNIVIEKYVWDSKVKPEFKVEIKDTTTTYHIYLNIRHADMYPFQNIWLVINTKFPDGQNNSQRIEITLANDEGKWYGDGLGDIWDFRTMIQENAVFKQPGQYTFRIEQNMRTDPLPGIMSVGLRIENTGMKKNP